MVKEKLVEIGLIVAVNQTDKEAENENPTKITRANLSIVQGAIR